MTDDNPKIVVRGLCKSFGSNWVLRDLDLDVAEGQSLAVIGGSGTGKSVLIKCIIGLLEPDSGSILVDGEETVGLPPHERECITRKFGMLFQGAALFDSQGMARREARTAALEAMNLVGLDSDIADRSPAELSGGMQKRAGLARAIATRPDILFFDEPTTGLDPIMGSVIDNLIVKSVRDLGATALTITHDMASARRIADNTAIIYEGRIVWHGPVAQIDRSENDMVDQFINGRSVGPIQLQVAV
jgi:phospholipid/cholesterol/gamma-HCH transport system ATP-binding protein